jgi:putative transposase
LEPLWRSLKYEEVYLHTYATVAEAKAGIGAWLSFHNDERQPQSLGYRQAWSDKLAARLQELGACRG